MTDKTMDLTDQRVGARILARRRQLGMSQSELAGKLNLSFQQIQKYERGTNRVSASTLYRIAHILDAPLMWFFENLQVATENDGAAATPFDQFLTLADGAEVATLWPQLPANLRPKLAALMRAMIRSEDG